MCIRDRDIRGDLDPEAQLVAELIRESLGNEIYDVKKGVARKVEYRDIVVLSRSRSAIGRMERFLNNEGIPAYGENTGGYFETCLLYTSTYAIPATRFPRNCGAKVSDLSLIHI